MLTTTIGWWRRMGQAALLALAASPALAAEEGHAEPSIFAGDLGNSLITLIIFGGVIFVLGKYAWGPLLRVLQQREENIHGALQKARDEREAAEKLLAEYQAQIDRAREDATAIVEEGKRDAEEVRRRIHEEAQQEARQMIERAKREIQLATDTAVKDLYDKTAELAVTVAGSVINRELSPKDHEQLVQQSLDEIRGHGPGRLN